jgi:NAD+--dinitrogen-reductase ADP-D-ribosyltransferase
MTSTPHDDAETTTLPKRARLALNRCNLPPVILGSLTFQRFPERLSIDGITTFHADLFAQLDACDAPQVRAEKFQDYMTVQFRLEHPEDMGGEIGKGRAKADYLRILRGWFFDSDGREGAVLKSWAESRFGLTVRHHKGLLKSQDDPAFAHFFKDRADGLYNTNALESQLDLVHTFCQYELARRHPGVTHLTLYRGVNRLGDFEVLQTLNAHEQVLLLNNVNSFTTERDTAGEFGDYILTMHTPMAKLFFFSGLLPGRMTGENEYIVLGGAYAVTIATF